MPNWCNNDVTIKHKDKAAIERVAKAFNEGRLCNEFIPLPEELAETTSPNRSGNENELIEKYGYSNWYDFQVSKWGTKWDISPDGGNAIVKGKKVCLNFDSAWSPPVGLYEKLIEEGYEVEAYYFEGGMGFYGCFTNDGEEQFEYTNISDVPEKYDVLFNIKETYEEF